MLRNKFSHFEHRNGAFAENGLQLGIGVDVAAVFSILKIVLLDVLPQFFNNLRAG